ncbi:MAG TPA: polysaccharide biosynthesis/export family protein [Bryobacteraceae bacterium]|nr:polysaccharide biosynthesis/export family protein [Bryobacteraceae bacterium]
MAFAQQPVQRANPTDATDKSDKQELGPATAKTAEEAENAVKTPVAIAPQPTAAPVDPKTYVIGAEDILMIRVWREPDLSNAVQVRPDGKITMQLIGEIMAAGETPEGLKNKITEALQEHIIKPDVFVSLQAVQSKKYYITGEVNRTGTFPLVVPTTVLEALTNAGGFREFADTKKITILRKGKTFKFNYRDVVRGKSAEQNILLEPGDLIYVP